MSDLANNWLAFKTLFKFDAFTDIALPLLPLALYDNLPLPSVRGDIQEPT
jgi:hypothetical protein